MQDRLQLFSLIMCLSWEHKTYYKLQSHITVNFSDFRCFLSQEYLPHFTTILPPQQLKQTAVLHWRLLASFSPDFFQAIAWHFLRSLILNWRDYRSSQHSKRKNPQPVSFKVSSNFSTPVQVFHCSTIAKTYNEGFFSWLPLLGER